MSRRERAIAALGLAIFLVCFALLPFPFNSTSLLPLCPFHNLTGLPCPLCGGTRAAHALLHGDLSRALYLNPLAILAVGSIVMVIFILGYEAISGKPLAHWSRIFQRASAFLPLGVTALALWWLPHLYLALRAPKTELLDLRNPIAELIHQKIVAPDAPPSR